MSESEPTNEPVIPEGPASPEDPANPAPLTGAVVHELIDELAGLDQRFLTGDKAQRDLPTVLEGYRWMFSILSVGLETFLWADVTAPRFTDIVGFNRKWGGDNSDAFYQYAPIDPARTYRVTGSPGRRRVLLPDRVRRTGRRPVLGAHRRHGQRPRRRHQR